MSLYFFSNVDILLIIFDLCDTHTLLQINRVCKQFYYLVRTILGKRSNNLLVTNQMSERFRERCKPLLFSYGDKFRAHYNWRNKIYKTRKIYSSLRASAYKTYKGLQMTENMIWLCDDYYLFGYYRAKDGNVKEDTIDSYCDFRFVDIVHCNNVIISSHEDGSIRHWKIVSQDKRNNLLQLKIHRNVHNYHPQIDATSQYIISSCNGFIKIQKNIHENDGSVLEENQIFYSNRQLDVLSLAFNPTGTKFAASAYIWDDFLYSSFLIFDIDTKSYPLMDKREVIQNKTSFNLYHQLLWEDPHTILICDHRDIKKMDIRTSKVVRTWDVPWNSRVYLSSFSSDNLYTIITGTHNGHIMLWDQRQSSPIQRYNTDDECCIYSVQFDSTHMYAAGGSDVDEFFFKDPTQHGEFPENL